MKKFKFRLQTVLEYRERLADQKKGELLKANQELTESEQEVSRLEALFLENTVNIQDLRHVSELQLNAQISQAINIKTEHAKAQVELKKLAVQEALDAYQQASKDLKAVGTLKERKLQEHSKQLAEYESSSMDELAIQRAARKGFE